MKRLLLSFLAILPTLTLTLATNVVSCGTKYEILPKCINDWDKEGIFTPSNAEKVYKALWLNKAGVIIPGSNGLIVRLDENGKYIEAPSSFEELEDSWENETEKIGMWQYIQLKYLIPSLVYFYEKLTSDSEIMSYEKFASNFEVTYEQKNPYLLTNKSEPTVSKVYNETDENYPLDEEKKLRDSGFAYDGAVSTYKWNSGQGYESYEADFWFKLTIKKDHQAEINGSLTQISKDGYYFNNADDFLSMSIGFYISWDGWGF
ncbi:hypothetical protein [Spiroplasma endosymbiont of Labia minor]|uniref:hypothetical protein n=1 Tax=Spiroplasma endosymbiont of Labia minor TaxID=3066305 RepID=UPI0030CB1B74